MKYLLLFLLFPVCVFAQNINQTKYTDMPNGGQVSDAVLDLSNNRYTIGFEYSATILRKYNSSGVLIWTKNLSSFLSNYSVSNLQKGLDIEYKGSDIYAVGKGTGSSARIIRSGNLATDATMVWDDILSSGSGSLAVLYDIKIVDNYLYVVGQFKGSITFFDGTTLNGSPGTTNAFFAKYSISPTKSLVWAKKIDASDTTVGTNIDADDVGNVFVGGSFKGTATFHNGTSPYTFTSTSTPSGVSNAFLAKFNNTGEFNASFGLKRNPNNASSRYSYDVHLKDNSLYWASGYTVFAYQKSGAGNLLWFSNIIDDRSNVLSVATSNRCGDVYITGCQAQGNNARMVFMVKSLNKNTGAITWELDPINYPKHPSYSCGREILLDSSDKVVFVGDHGFPHSDSLNINGDVSPYTYALFIGRFGGRNCGFADPDYPIGKNKRVAASGYDKITLYPNPATNKVTLNLNDVTSGSLELYSLDGKLILNETFSDKKEMVIDLSNYAQGIYLIKANINGKIISKKIIKE